MRSGLFSHSAKITEHSILMLYNLFSFCEPVRNNNALCDGWNLITSFIRYFLSTYFSYVQVIDYSIILTIP